MLDESGVKLSSDATLTSKSSASGVGSRRFIFDKPFLLMLDQPRDEAVYLAVWVETPELLAPQ